MALRHWNSCGSPVTPKRRSRSNSSTTHGLCYGVQCRFDVMAKRKTKPDELTHSKPAAPAPARGTSAAKDGNGDGQPPESTGQDPAGPEPTEQADRQAMPVDHEKPPKLAFPVVGVGASAGGLEAFTEF